MSIWRSREVKPALRESYTVSSRRKILWYTTWHCPLDFSFHWEALYSDSFDLAKTLVKKRVCPLKLWILAHSRPLTRWKYQFYYTVFEASVQQLKWSAEGHGVIGKCWAHGKVSNYHLANFVVMSNDYLSLSTLCLIIKQKHALTQKDRWGLRRTQCKLAPALC